MKPRVLVEQYVLPDYREAFFEALSKRVDLVVVSSAAPSMVTRETAGMAAAEEGRFPFEVQFLPERRVAALRYVYHEGLPELVRRTERDVCVTNYKFCRSYWLYPPLARRRRQVPLRMLLWSSDGYDAGDLRAHREALMGRWVTRGPRGLKKRLGYLAHRWLASQFDGHLTYSELTARFWREVYDVPADRITVAWNSLDTSVVETHCATLVANGVPRIPRRLVFVGRLVEENKRVADLLRACRLLEGEFPDLSLVVAGDGPDRGLLERLTQELGLKRVKFVGAVREKLALAELLHESSLYVMPYLGGLGINEAMAAGLPVVCSTADGTERDLVSEGENGFFFKKGSVDDLARVLREALRSEKQLAEMGAASLSRLQSRLNLGAMVDAFVDRIEACSEG